ncbi:MFS general substrate transporter [Backusella circina FSU 941]|nr:MFS general substrate transporter [Backusella circina FSU 941]
MHNRTALVIAISCISSLSSGLVIGASSVPTEGQDLCWEFLKFYDTSQTSCSPMSNSLWNFFLVTSFCISAFISSLLGGIITTKFGRKNTLLYNNIFFFLGGMLTCFAASPAMFCIGRMVSGAGCGLVFVTVPIYIAEVSPSRSDGLLTTFHHASVALGVLVSSLLSIYGSTPPVWRFTFGFVTIPAFIQSPLLYLLCVETPVHLILMNKFTLAEDALRTLRDGEFVGIEFTEMKRLQPIEQAPPTTSTPANSPVDIEAGPQVSIQYYPIMGLRSIFTNGKELRNRVIAVIYINVIQQLFGISAVVFFYPTRIMSFYDEGAGADYAVGITICYFYSIILAMLLLDHVPNYRNLMAGSGIGILLFSILFTIGFVTGAPLLSLISVYLYIISFTMGACMIPSIILGRGIATHAVASTSSISTALAWLIQILIAQCFPLLLSSIQGYVFLIFGFSTIGLIPFMHYVFIKGLD